MPAPGSTASLSDAYRQVVLQRPGGLRIVLTDLGATWMSCQVPLADGTRREVLLGYDRPEDYLAQPGYLGAIVGRYANRIAQARYLHQGAEVRLAANEGAHQLHGGPQGFDRRRWHVEAHGPHEAVMTLRSDDGDQGFPGEVHALVHYALESPLGVTIRLQATATRTTPLALTSHAYFNLDAVHADCRTHGLRLHAGQVVPVDAQLIPQGTLDVVAGTDFDFRSWRRIGDLASGCEPPGRQGLFDHCFLLDERCRDGTLPAAELESPDGRLAARLYTDRPAVQFYSGQWLATTRRRGGGAYAACQGLALEPGVPPDSPNRPQWQPWSDCFVEPGTPWRAWMRWEFQTR
jgi:aldose 1-epimerase